MSQIEKRKFPRIAVKTTHPDVPHLGGVSALWPGGEVSDVLDMSYTGAALSRPAKSAVAEQDRVRLEFRVQGTETVPIEAEIVRSGEHVVGVRFCELSTEARLCFEKFLKEKLLGLSLRLVNPHYYGSKLDFTYWFHGPNETNIFLWVEKKALKKAMIELGSEVLLFEDNTFSEGESSSEHGARSAKMLRSNVQGGSALMKKVFELAAQVQEGRELLEPLLRKLGERVQRS